MITHADPPQETTAFSMRLIAQVCDGPQVLRNRLNDAGLDDATIAQAVSWSPRALARMRHGHATPRGVLVRLGALAVIVEQLRAGGVPIDALTGPHDAHAHEVLAHIGGQSPIAAKVLAAIRRAQPIRPTPQLRLDLAA